MNIIKQMEPETILWLGAYILVSVVTLLVVVLMQGRIA